MSNENIISKEQARRLYASRKSDYEVKIVFKSSLSKEEKVFVEKMIDDLLEEFQMYLHDDGETYSKKPPYVPLADIPAGFSFYNRILKYKRYFSRLEYYSYLEGDYNGQVYRKL